MAGLTLRDRLAGKKTQELVEILKRWDTNEWQAEVFALATDILRGRGVTPPSPPAREAMVGTQAAALVPTGWQGLTTVAIFESVVAAEACRAALCGAGFSAVIRNQFVLQQDPSLAAMADWVQVAVPDAEGEEAALFIGDRERGGQ
jgi:hypothetical protein